MKFPKTIYVCKVKDGDTTYLESHESVSDIGDHRDGEMVGIYNLVESKQLRIRQELE